MNTNKLFEEIKIRKFKDFVNQKYNVVYEQEGGDTVSIRDSGDLEKYLELFLKKNKLDTTFTAKVEDYGTGEVIIGDVKNPTKNYGTVKVKKEGKGVNKIYLTITCNIPGKDGSYETFNNPILLVDILKVLASKEMLGDKESNSLTQLISKQNPTENKIIVKSF